jgi:hypothetical protein
MLDTYGAADATITNPPYTRPLMHALIAHFARVLPTWLLLDMDWASTQQSAPFMPSCSDIVPVGRVRWIAGTDSDGFDNSAWYRFDSRHSAGPVFHGRGSPSCASLCAQCGRAYRPQRSDSKFCSSACRQHAYRGRLAVTQA